MKRRNTEVTDRLNKRLNEPSVGEVSITGRNGITEIIPEITDKEVKIQLLSGESELNYLIGGDKKLNGLAPGSYSVLFPGSSSGDIFIPVFSSNEEKVYNEYRIVEISGNPATTSTGRPL